MGTCLVSGMSQGVDEWSDVDHQDVPTCLRQQSEADVTSDISDSNSRTGSRNVDPKQQHQLSIGGCLGHEGSMHMVRIAYSGATQVKNHERR